jgi:hypothetical protein
MVTGNVSNTSTGFMKELMRDNTTAATTAFQLLATATPGSNQARKTITTAEINTRAIQSFMCKFLSCLNVGQPTRKSYKL